MNNTPNFDADEYAHISSHERDRIRTLPLNDQYTARFEYQGRIYFYDPDRDAFYAPVPWAEQSYWDRWGWIYTVILLLAVCWYLS